MEMCAVNDGGVETADSVDSSLWIHELQIHSTAAGWLSRGPFPALVPILPKNTANHYDGRQRSGFLQIAQWPELRSAGRERPELRPRIRRFGYCVE